MSIQTELVFTGRELRNGGILVAANNADQHFDGWSEMAYQALEAFIRTNKAPFLCETVRQFSSEILELPLPPNNRAWGGIFLRAAKEKIIIKVGYGQVENPRAHMANAALWQAA